MSPCGCCLSITSTGPRECISMRQHSNKQCRRVSDPLKLGLVRLAFKLGGRVSPQRTVNRAGRLFATPLPSSRSRARATKLIGETQRGEITVADNTIATYV